MHPLLKEAADAAHSVGWTVLGLYLVAQDHKKRHMSDRVLLIADTTDQLRNSTYPGRYVVVCHPAILTNPAFSGDRAMAMGTFMQLIADSYNDATPAVRANPRDPATGERPVKPGLGFSEGSMERMGYARDGVTDISSGRCWWAHPDGHRVLRGDGSHKIIREA